MLRSIRAAPIVAAVVLFATPALAAPPFKARASLAGDTPMKGRASLQQKHNGQGPNRLDVHVERALPLQTFDVAINGVIVGQIVTNPGGAGRLRLTGLTEAVMPGDVITVGPVSGAFAAPGSTDDS